MKKKDFDCVEMMHSGQAASERRLQGLSPEARRAYWLRRQEELLAEQARAASKRLTPAS